jgi:hypothetical protein
MWGSAQLAALQPVYRQIPTDTFYWHGHLHTFAAGSFTYRSQDRACLSVADQLWLPVHYLHSCAQQAQSVWGSLTSQNPT